MSNVKRGDRATFNGDRPLKHNEKIVEQADGSVLSVITRDPTIFVDDRTGEEFIRPSSDARTSRVDIPGDRENGNVPWYIKHMIPSEERTQYLEDQAAAKRVETDAREAFEKERAEKRSRANIVNPIRAREEAAAKLREDAKAKRHAGLVEFDVCPDSDIEANADEEARASRKVTKKKGAK